MSVASWSYMAPVVASWARARTSKGRHFTAPKHAEAMRSHELCALAARPRGWRTDGVYTTEIHYHPADRRRRDSDRVGSLVLDALCGVAWDDDSDRYIRGYYCAPTEIATFVPRGFTRVAITRIGDAPTATKRKRGAR